MQFCNENKLMVNDPIIVASYKASFKIWQQWLSSPYNWFHMNILATKIVGKWSGMELKTFWEESKNRISREKRAELVQNRNGLSRTQFNNFTDQLLNRVLDNPFLPLHTLHSQITTIQSYCNLNFPYSSAEIYQILHPSFLIPIILIVNSFMPNA